MVYVWVGMFINSHSMSKFQLRPSLGWGIVLLITKRAKFFQASIVCKNLGYFDALKFTQESFFGEVSGPFSFDNVKCSGFESQLIDCKHLDVDDCTSREGAGAICQSGASKFLQAVMSPLSNQTNTGKEDSFIRNVTLNWFKFTPSPSSTLTQKWPFY